MLLNLNKYPWCLVWLQFTYGNHGNRARPSNQELNCSPEMANYQCVSVSFDGPSIAHESAKVDNREKDLSLRDEIMGCALQLMYSAIYTLINIVGLQLHKPCIFCFHANKADRLINTCVGLPVRCGN